MIEEKYKGISKIPEALLGFTTPIRQSAITQLNLAYGSSVIDVGCGTGASFLYLEKIIGESGNILGVEPSKSMIAVANNRVTNNGWKNVTLCENTIEKIETGEKFDGALLFAMHDVFNSLEGIKKIYSLLKVDARIVCVGPKTQEKGLMKLLNPMLHLLFKRMALSQNNKDKPWRLVESVFTTEKIIHEKHGLIFIYIGRR
ncbi:MAG: class I SAM-dependent methyltransferase [Chloroflexi bacterium]|nr:class I SAM-dependent methyltransferase [Chloroflexota bacterium]